MTWKLYALTSSGAVLAGWLVSTGPATERHLAAPGATRQAAERSESAIDLGAQADRLRAGVAATTYQEPVRNAFHFGRSARRGAQAPSAAAVEVAVAPVPPVPVRPQFGLAGVASSVIDGVTERTAILSSIRGVQLVKEGDVVEGGYRVVTVSDDMVIVESQNDGTRTTLRLSTP